MFWIACALILATGVVLAYHTARTCTTVELNGIGVVHLHEWPTIAGRRPPRQVLYFPEGQEYPYVLDLTTASLVLSSRSLLEAVRYARQGGPDGHPSP